MTGTCSSPPVLLIVFNRVETTRRTLRAISVAAPKRLFVAADGPRPGNADDAAKCAAVLKEVRGSISWDCEASFLERKSNLGCGRGPSTAISWFFDNVSEGIILEDDCLPAPGFFLFCASVLERYRDEGKVGHVGGFNCQFGRSWGDASYYFSRYFHAWGWATWRRAWKDFDFGMADYPAFTAERVLDNIFERQSVRDFWTRNFNAVRQGRQDIWDYQWVYSNLKNDRLAVVPNRNLIENIGFGSDATHTAKKNAAMPPVQDSLEEIHHPKFIMACREADDFTFRTHAGLDGFHDAKQAAKRLLRGLRLYRGGGHVKEASIGVPMAEARIIMREETVRRPEPVNLRPGDEVLFAHEYVRRLGTVQTRALREVTVLPNGFLLSGGRLLSESFGGRPRGMYALRLKGSLVKNVFRARRKVLVEDALFITDEFSNGFFHWICDVLPRLEAIDRRELSGRTIVIPAMADYPYVSESLAAYRVVRACRLARTERAQCANLLAVSAAAPTGNYRPALMASLRDRFRSHFGVPPGRRKIYISRSGAPLRRIANEEELLPILEKNGFETVRAETLSFAEQVSIIGTADILVSNHGAGLTNMAWMLPETRVLELRSAGDWQNNCYYSLASALGIAYHYQLCAPAQKGQSTHLADLVVDAAELEKQLAAISHP